MVQGAAAPTEGHLHDDNIEIMSTGSWFRAAAAIFADLIPIETCGSYLRRVAKVE